MEKNNFLKIQPKYEPKENMFTYKYNDIIFFVENNYLYIPKNLSYENKVETTLFTGESKKKN